MGLFALVLATFAFAYATGLTVSSASADETSCGAGYTDNPEDPNTSDLVCIPDPGLLEAVDKLKGLAAGTPVTVAQAQSITGLSAGNTKAYAIGNLTGLQVFTKLTLLQFAGTANTFTDLTPIGGLTKLTNLALGVSKGSGLTGAELGPLDGLTNLKTLQIVDPIANFSAISDLTELTSLTIGNDPLPLNISTLPAMPDIATLALENIPVRDPSLLVGKLAGSALTLKTLNLAEDGITDASSLAPLGESGTTLGSTGTMTLSGNQIKDFSAFSGWTKKPVETGQTVYVGPYKTGGVTVELNTGTTTSPSIPASEGTYDPSTGLLTAATEPAPETVAVSPDWTVNFSWAPGDTGGPTIVGNGGVAVTAVHVGEGLGASLKGEGSLLGECKNVSYRWLRDGAPIPPVPHADDDQANFPEASIHGPMGVVGSTSGYFVSATDLGHQISVTATCEDTTGPDAGLSLTSGVTEPVTSGYAAEQPMIQAMDGYTAIQPDPSGSGNPLMTAEPRSGVIDDPHNESLPVYVGQLDEHGNLVDPSELNLAVTSVSGVLNGGGLTPSEVKIATDPDDPALRTISFEPNTVGATLVTFTLTGTTGLKTTFEVQYYSSMATTPTSTVLENSSDDSTAIDVGDGYFMVGDDEKSNIGLYDGDVSGREVAQFPPPASLAYSIVGELDLEASAQQGKELYFFGSEGNDKSGNVGGGRGYIFQETLHGSGANATLTPGVKVGGPKNELIVWDEAHGNKFGLAAGSAGGQVPETYHGFDLEGAEFSPDGSELYFGMRAPIYPAEPGGDAVIFTVTNFDEVIAAAEAGKAVPHWAIGEPILLNLGGQTIREIRKNADGQYLILSGQGATEAAPRSGVEGNELWAWDGERGDQPQLLSTSQAGGQPSTLLPADQAEHETNEESGDWEGIADMPDLLTPGSQVRLLMDQGFDLPYGSGHTDENKKLGPYTSKGRTDVFTMSGPAGAVASLSGSGAFPDQAANTVGAPRSFTVANEGSEPLAIGKLKVSNAAGEPDSDFLIGGENCSDETLAIGASCTVQVRFAPTAPDGPSAAKLVVDSNVPGGSTTVDLTGTSTELPKGEKGDTGQTGSTGQAGPRGDPGETGAQGEPGPRGATGADGQAGPQGNAGAQGATGPKGDAGPAGPQGPAGPRGPAGVSVKSTEGGSTITVDSKGDLVVKVANPDKGAARLRLRALATVDGRKVTISSRTVTVKGGHLEKVELKVSEGARRKLGHQTHPLEVTATPVGARADDLAIDTLRTKVAAAGPRS